jgi:hypothetical protein
MVRKVLVGGWVCLASAGSSALSLGALEGQAVIGRPLRVVLPVAAAASESINSLCPVVKVYFADNLVPAAQVRVDTLADASGAAGARLEIRTLTPLLEPFVRLDAVAGCGNQHSRSYTLLAELPSVESEVASSAPKASAVMSRGAAASLAAADPAQTSPLASPGAGTRRRSELGDRPDMPLLTRKGRERDGRTKGRLSKPSSEAGVPLAHLTLDPLELVSAVSTSMPVLRMSSELTAGLAEAETASAELEGRRSAAAALWSAMNESPESVAQVKAQAQASEAESRQLKVAIAASRQAEQSALQQAEEAKNAVYTHPLTLTALFGFVAAALGMGFLWRRQRDAGAVAWWQRTGGGKSEERSSTEGLGARVSAKLKGLKSPSKVDARESQIDIDIDTLLPDSSPAPVQKAFALEDDRVSEFLESRTDVSSPSDFLVSTLVDGGRSVATEELLDLQQQVEFFISLGQADHAVEVLVNHLSDSHEPSPLAYLDLLKLYHELGRRDEYESLRVEFNRLFRGGAPGFDSYSHSRRGLERYESAMSRIQSLWPRPEVLDVIERSIFRQDVAEQDMVFDLEAYRELLLLYSVARELNVPDNEASGGAAPKSRNPVSAEGDAANHGEETELTPLPMSISPATSRSESLLVRGAGTPNDIHRDLVLSEPVSVSAPLDIDLSAAFEVPPDASVGVIDLDLGAEIHPGGLTDAEPAVAGRRLDSGGGVIGLKAAERAPGRENASLGGLDFSALVDQPLVIRKSGERS